MLGPDCDGRYDNGRLCMITDHPLNETLDGGPFPAGTTPPPLSLPLFKRHMSHAGEWSVFVPVDYYQLVVPFMTQQYGDELTTQLALLVHTNTGCEYEDHSKWALWAGQKWQVQLHPPPSPLQRVSPCLSCTPPPHLPLLTPSRSLFAA